MPNSCWNVFTIIGETDVIEQIYETELKQLEDIISPEDKPIIHFIKRSDTGIKFELYSKWEPDKEWINNLMSKYPSVFLKNEWSEEGGCAGVIVGGTLHNKVYPIKEMSWVDVPIEDEFHPYYN